MENISILIERNVFFFNHQSALDIHTHTHTFSLKSRYAYTSPLYRSLQFFLVFLQFRFHEGARAVLETP